MGDVVSFPGGEPRERNDNASPVQREMRARLRTAERRVQAGEAVGVALAVVLADGSVWFSWAGSTEPAKLSGAARTLASEIERNPVRGPPRGER